MCFKKLEYDFKYQQGQNSRFVLFQIFFCLEIWPVTLIILTWWTKMKKGFGRQECTWQYVCIVGSRNCQWIAYGEENWNHYSHVGAWRLCLHCHTGKEGGKCGTEWNASLQRHRCWGREVFLGEAVVAENFICPPTASNRKPMAPGLGVVICLLRGTWGAHVLGAWALRSCVSLFSHQIPENMLRWAGLTQEMVLTALLCTQTRLSPNWVGSGGFCCSLCALSWVSGLDGR